MRLGAITERSIQDILRSMASQRDKTLQWASGQEYSPVLCAFKRGGCDIVNTDKAANFRQPCLIICDTSLKAGLLVPVIPHDIRRGAAKDTAHLKHNPTSLATLAVAAELGQTTCTLQADITTAYVGNQNDDTWTKRVNAEFTDPFELNVTEKVYKRQKLNMTELVSLYIDSGVDPFNNKVIQRV